MPEITHQPSGIAKIRRALRLIVVNGVAGPYLVPKRLRLWLYRSVGYTIGASVFFSATIIRSHKLEVGDDCFVNHGCYFGDGAIRLGRSVFLGPGVSLISSDHTIGRESKRAGHDVLSPIIIHDGVWIGARAVVLGDVEIAHGCVIGAGAVVTKSTQPNGLYVGVPAKRVRDL